MVNSTRKAVAIFIFALLSLNLPAKAQSPGDVNGPPSSTTGDIATYGDMTGKNIVDSNIPGTWNAIHGNVCYVDGNQYSTLQAALTASCANIVVSTPQTLSSVVSITYSTNIQCANGAAFTETSAGALNYSTNNLTLQGCTFNGPGTSITSTNTPFSGTGDYLTLAHNVWTNFGPTQGHGVVFVENSSHFRFNGNRIFGNSGTYGLTSYIGSNGYTQTDWWITNNYIQNSLLVQAIATSPVTVRDIHVVNNNLTTGAGTTEFCAEIGNFAGGVPGTVVDGIVISGNKCLMESSGQNGGFSLSNVQGAVVSSNYIYGQGNGWTIEGIEYTASTVQGGSSANAVITGNYIEADGSQGIICGACGYANISNNVIRNTGSASNTWGIGVITNTTNGNNAGAVVINNNEIDGINGGDGIRIEAQSASNVIVSVTAVGNALQGAQGSGTGIHLHGGGSGVTVANILEGPNEFANLGNGLWVDSGVSTYCHVAGFNAAATPVRATSGTNICH